MAKFQLKINERLDDEPEYINEDPYAKIIAN